MDLLKQALLAKKQQVEQKKEVAQQVAQTEGRKYLRRGEISELEAAKEAAKRRRDEEEQAEQRKRVKEDPSKQRETKDSSSLDMDAPAPSSDIELDPEEVKMRLRSMGEPITLFGETPKMRLDRLRLLQLTLSERAANTTGRSNMMHDILQREVASEIMRLTEEQIELSKTQSDEQKAAAVKKEQKKASKYDVPRTRSSCSCAEDYIFYFFKRILRLWERDLQERPDAEKRTASGQRASAAQKQTRHNLKPLMKQLSNRTVEKDLVTGLEKVVLLCEQREYIKANEEYLLIAIGNAAWPIGVTMVGIHERSGREKIFAQNVAHVLNDETSRKYVQAVKRLMTFHQTKYPNADASKNIQSRNQV